MTLRSIKPAAPARVHLLLAGIMWTIVGSVMASFGVSWVIGNHAGRAGWILAGAIILGLIKSRFVLDHAATRISERILLRGDGRCIGGFLSVRSWGLVVFMAGAGRLLRATNLPPAVAGVIYVAVGVALVASSRRIWRAWRELRR